MAKDGNPKQVSPETASIASQRAKDRANAGRWDLNTAIFLFAVLILVIILATYTKVRFEVMALIAVFGLAMVWLVGWRQGQSLYNRYYEEELASLNQESKSALKEAVKETLEETIEEQVQKALRERWR